MDTKTKMTTQEKAEELVDNLGVSHAIYVTEEVIAILEDWEGTELAKKDWIKIQEIVSSIPLPYSVDEDISLEDIKSEENELKTKLTDKLPDGVLWEKAKEYSKQFAIRDKPVQSEIAMNEAQDHYYRGMIASRDMLS
jgi:hypothetical protein